jgi:hypothetical protein
VVEKPTEKGCARLVTERQKEVSSVADQAFSEFRGSGPGGQAAFYFGEEGVSWTVSSFEVI